MTSSTPFKRQYDRKAWTPTYLAAQAYADDGWPVFPVDAATKVPLTKWRKGNDSERATTNADLVLVWWTKQHPQAAVAVETGAASGLFVLDVDPDEGGDVSLAALLHKHGPLPETLTATTPRGGTHYVFSASGGKTTAGDVGDGLDTRGDGGMFVAPPSARPDGAAYEWVDADVLPAPAPRWLLALAAAGSADAAPTQDGGVRRVQVPVAEYVETAFANDLQAVRDAEEGTRNHALNVAAYNAGRRIAGGHQGEDEARERLMAAAEAAGLLPGEIAATINSGLRDGQQKPRRIEQQLSSESPADDVAKELRRLRAKHEASRLFAQEQYASRAVVLPRLTLKEALAAERPKEPPLRVRDLHRVGYNTTISAAYKTGKTTLGGNLIRALADGGHFLDRFAVNPPAGRIGLLNYELTDVDMLDWLESQGIGSDDRVAVLNLRGVPFTLSVEQHTAELVAWCREMDVEVLHLDPHRRAFAGFGSENSNDDVNRFTDALDVLKREAGVADLFLYVHMGRVSGEMGAEHARGATALDDWADQRWVLTKNDEQERFLYADGRLPFVPEFKLDYDPGNRRLSAGEGNRRDAGLEKNKAAVLAGLELAGATGALVGELERKLKVTKKGALSPALRALVADGLIVQRPAPNNAKRQWLPQFAPEEQT